METGTWSQQQIAAGCRIETYLRDCAGFVYETFAALPRSIASAEQDRVDAVLRVLLRREFHYQSNGKVAHLLPDIRSRIERVVLQGRPLPLYLLYHGGYRASVDALHELLFAPDATELLLLFQVARLQRAIAAVYPPGVSFGIVINNGVAYNTNGIPFSATERYVAHLRSLIDRCGAGAAISVVVQSELSFEQDVTAPTDSPPVDETTHAIVERFLGRRCSSNEAAERSALYLAAERAWASHIGVVVGTDAGIEMRQVAHPACLSFRPFPGGAIRVQNGSIGARLREGDSDPVPFLVTSNRARQGNLLAVPVRMAAILADASQVDVAA